MSAETGLTKEEIEEYLKELSKEYRKLTGGKMDTEIVIVGGGAIVLNHSFREATNDIDVMIERGSAIQTAAKHVGDQFSLPENWFNTDFQYTSSYSDALREVAAHYRTFSNHVDIRVIPDVYVIAMKLVSDRDYKHDHSDIVGILGDHARNGDPISKEQIESAVDRLYHDLGAVPEGAWEFLDDIMENGDYDRLYDMTSSDEQENRLSFIEEESDQNAVQTASLTDVLEKISGRDENEET